MNKERLNEILNQDIIYEIYYNNKPVWVQEAHDDIAKISFLDAKNEKNVFITDLYEKQTIKK